MTLEQEIQQALIESIILECGRTFYDHNHMLETAQRLSLAPFSFVQEVYNVQYSQ